MSNVTINGVPVTPAALAADIVSLQAIVAAKSIFLTGFTIFLWDYIIQFSEEVAQVWKKHKGFVLRVYLFLRYYALGAAAVIITGYFSPSISGLTCSEWMYFIPFGMIIPLMIMSGTLMAVRIYAIYSKSKIILGFLLSILTCQACMGIYIWTFNGAHPSTNPIAPIENFDFHYCIFIPAAKLGSLSSAYAFLELSFDTVCFALTLGRPIWGRIYRQETWGNHLVKNLAQNGALYFGVIFSVNLAWAIMILHASTGLRGSLAAPSSMMMTSFIARITLNLRSSVYGQNLDEKTVADSEYARKGYNVGGAGGESFRLGDIRRPFTNNSRPAYDTSYMEFSPQEVWIKSETVTNRDGY